MRATQFEGGGLRAVSNTCRLLGMSKTGDRRGCISGANLNVLNKPMGTMPKRGFVCAAFHIDRF